MSLGIGTFIILGFVTIALLLSARMISNGLYQITKMWRELVFLAACAVIGTLFAFNHDSISRQASFLYGKFQEPSEQITVATINHCRSFVQAKLDGRNYSEPGPARAGFTRVNAVTGDMDSLTWEICAKTFGLNYWKHDISIHGRSGGHVLCDAYDQESAVSGKVLVWCETVFSPEHKI